MAASIFLASCVQTIQSPGSGEGAIPTMQGPSEVGYCSNSTTYSSPVTVTGHADFIRRDPYGTSSSGGLGSASLTGTHPASSHPIRYAEVRVTNSIGEVVQCAETDASGNFSFTLPNQILSYTVEVTSRSAPSTVNTGGVAHLYASVLDAPNSNVYYSLKYTFLLTGATTLPTFTAQASGDVTGGAFNILDQLLNANLFLMSEVGTCGSTFTGCENYNPGLHKIAAYWKKGFNPNEYFGQPSSGLSFYLPGYSRLFILGGIGGDTDNTDTDHFDNSIIVHEYGHFLEDNWLQTDSPGGSHDGNSVLDPRLAWSEGWADFFQAAVHSWICSATPSDTSCPFDHYYVDTVGNDDGTTDLQFYVDTETVNSGGFDYTTVLGEGNFREFSVTRLLFDAVDDTPTETQFAATDNVKNGFPQIWAAASKSTYGFRDSNFAFRNIGLLHLSQIWLANHNGGDDWSQIRSLNRQTGDTSHYAQYVIPEGSGSCASSASVTPTNPLGGGPYYFSLTPSGTYSSVANTDLFGNNRFYHLHISSAQTGAHTLQLKFEDDDGIGPAADLDLYLYDKEARFAVTSDIVSFSQNGNSGSNPARTLQTETASASLAAGDYLINVNALAAAGQADFDLYLDGVRLCPANLVPP